MLYVNDRHSAVEILGVGGDRLTLMPELLNPTLSARRLLIVR
jgi:hypothetical protein